MATARFSTPRGLAYDAARQLLFLADMGNSRIRQISMATGIVSTVAGNGPITTRVTAARRSSPA